MENRCEYSALTIPNELPYVSVAATYVDAIAQKMGYGEKDREDITTAVNETVSNVIKYAFDPDERATFTISCERVPLGLKITVRDRGIPFFPKTDERGVGTPLMRELMDEVAFHNLGRKGKETVLIKYALENAITDFSEACNLEPYDDPKMRKTATSRHIGYTVRKMQPEEAIEISRTVYRAYGYSYPVPHVYYPERMAKIITSGVMYSAVAETDTGDLAGHCALFRWEPDSRLGELGLGVVKPEYRGLGMFLALTSHLIEIAKAQKLMGIFGQAVTNHTFSQQVGHKCGLKDCGIILGLLPETEQFRGITERLPQRESLAIHFLYLNKPDEVRIHPPLHHLDMIRKLYRNIGLEPSFGPAQMLSDMTEEAIVRMESIGPKGAARITVDRYGKNVVAEVKKRLKDLCLNRFRAIHLYLDLSDPLTGAYTELFERLGFFFAGILPGACHGDGLILQFLNNVPLDYNKIKVESNIAKELLQYIRDHDPSETIS
jgi:serine/threonine-protein kinase RsbW